MLDWLVGLLFGATYGLLVSVAALLLAVPYGLWRGMVLARDRLTKRRKAPH